MIRFLIKGMIRDRHRSLFPVIVVSFGVLLTTVIYSYIDGELDTLIGFTAKFDTGHLKITTIAYNKTAGQSSMDLALSNVDNLIYSLNKKFPDYEWTPRIKFGGLIDIPDENGETKAQHPILGLAVNLLGKNTSESIRLNLDKAITGGSSPSKPGEILLSDELARRMHIEIGQSVTLLSKAAGGGLAVQNFVVCGTVVFGIAAMDRGSIIADFSDMQNTLELNRSSTEILGFSRNNFYYEDEAEEIKNIFNKQFLKSEDRFSPIMQTLGDQNGLNEWLLYVHAIGALIIGLFLIAMSIVLLNTGLMSGIRRYGEIGVRLALGESKDHIFNSILYEAILVGITGSVIGTAFGLAISLYLQEYGLDISHTLRESSIMMPNYLRAKISSTSFYIGFVPGLIATLIGTTFSGIQIYKRQTASLFRELET